MGDHDALFKRVFAVPENAAGMLRSLLPAELVAALDLSRLELLSGESITATLDEQRADLLFRAPLLSLTKMARKSTCTCRCTCWWSTRARRPRACPCVRSATCCPSGSRRSAKSPPGRRCRP
ncbi:MAG: Rpn family recombination-promoting nuclease/putative transposase [Sandaracinaceae bacterium]|nr:Rpn family recombination-promoting nuclease/putative transposase [Sandaracinaceae bacterium]